MNDFTKIEKLLSIVKSKIDTHKEFKQEYNKQLAFDFSLFNFFNVGENKVSQILAYFLDEKQNHGQGNLFLNEFLNQFYGKEIDTTNSINICEKVITKNRRIDIYLEIGKLIIAIENKIWADDQVNQIKDYAIYLENKSKGNFLLLYLNPYGLEPTNKSISEDFKQQLVKKNQFKVISYKHDIINLINKWLVICEADNVSFFIKEFKKFLEVKFLGNNTLNMSKKLREIIEQYPTEVQTLVNEYKNIENEIIGKLNEVGKALANEMPNMNTDLEIRKSNVFNWKGARVYKYSISKGDNKIYIEYVKREIHLYSNYYLQEGTDIKFQEIVKNTSELNNNLKIEYTKSKNELIRMFISQVEKVNEVFEQYDKLIND